MYILKGNRRLKYCNLKGVKVGENINKITFLSFLSFLFECHKLAIITSH